jgi:intein-encoded DNA endonuclease-like protein
VEGPREGFQEVKGMAQVPGFCPEGEEVKKTDNTTNTKKKGPYLPRELRIKIFNDAIALHQQGRSYKQIINVIEQKYGVELSKSTISDWVRGIHSPYNGRRIPSIEMLEPSEDLAYDIGVIAGDGSAHEKRRIHKGYRRAVVHLEAKDREFVEEFAIRISRVLDRPPPKATVNFRGLYYVEVGDRTLYELLKKPIDIEKIRRFVEHCERCMAMFLRGFFDSEGSVNEDGQISLTNTNYELLLYVQELLRRFGIETTGPYPTVKQGTPFYDPRKGKVYKYNKDAYVLYVRKSSNYAFYKYVGFTILRKRARLEEYLRRKGIPIPTPLIPFCILIHLVRLWAPSI